MRRANKDFRTEMSFETLRWNGRHFKGRAAGGAGRRASSYFAREAPRTLGSSDHLAIAAGPLIAVSRLGRRARRAAAADCLVNHNSRIDGAGWLISPHSTIQTEF